MRKCRPTTPKAIPPRAAEIRKRLEGEGLGSIRGETLTDATAVNISNAFADLTEPQLNIALSQFVEYDPQALSHHRKLGIARHACRGIGQICTRRRIDNTNGKAVDPHELRRARRLLRSASSLMQPHSRFWDNQAVSTALNIPLSLEEFMLRPDREDGQKEELIEGELIVSPGAKVWHAAIVDRLRERLTKVKDAGFVLPSDFACVLGRVSMPAPDLAAVSVQRWNQAEDNDGWLEGSPELVVEVASPSNRKLQRKAALYLDHGAEQVWLIYRKTQTVTVMTSEGTSEARMGETLEFRGVRVPVTSFMKRD